MLLLLRSRDLAFLTARLDAGAAARDFSRSAFFSSMTQYQSWCSRLLYRLSCPWPEEVEGGIGEAIVPIDVQGFRVRVLSMEMV